MKVRGTDVVVSNMGSALTPKPFSAAVVDRITPLPHVAETCALLVDLMSVEKAEMMIVSARQWGGFSWNNLKIVSGRLPNRRHGKGGGARADRRRSAAKESRRHAATRNRGTCWWSASWTAARWWKMAPSSFRWRVFQEITGNEGKSMSSMCA